MSYFSYAQLIDNKINIYFGYSIADFHGQNVLKEGDFISTSLFPNYLDVKGASFKGLIELNQFCSIGAGFDMISASNWQNHEYYDYLRSNANQYSISPTIQIHTKFKEAGISNRMKLFIEIAPIIGMSNINLSRVFFETQNQIITQYQGSTQNRSLTVSTPNESSDRFYGAKGSTGLEWAINHYAGIYFTYSIQQSKITSKFYNDKQFLRSQLDFGIFLRFKKDKRYFY